MHPLLRGRRAIFYLVAWLPVSRLLAMFFEQSGLMQWPEAAALSSLLSAVFAMICLSAWYLSRYMPISEEHLTRSVTIPIVASLVAAWLWVLSSRMLASLLASTTSFTEVEGKMAKGENWLWATGALLYLLSVSLSYMLVEVESARAAKVREVEALTMAREAELKALRQQVNPHFLFNSLNSISALVGMDKQRAREMCALLADFLRLSLGVGDRRFIPLREELTLVRHYLSIEKVRFDQRLNFEEHIQEESLEVPVPPLLLQPLVENAVKHGVAQSIEGGTIRLETSVDAREVTIAVTNTFEEDMPPRKGAGVGLANIEKRLATLYGGAARLATHAGKGEFRAEIRLLLRATEGA